MNTLIGNLRNLFAIKSPLLPDLAGFAEIVLLVQTPRYGITDSGGTVARGDAVESLRFHAGAKSLRELAAYLSSDADEVDAMDGDSVVAFSADGPKTFPGMFMVGDRVIFTDLRGLEHPGVVIDKLVPPPGQIAVRLDEDHMGEDTFYPESLKREPKVN